MDNILQLTSLILSDGIDLKLRESGVKSDIKIFKKGNKFPGLKYF
jgi:hypothetical protein